MNYTTLKDLSAAKKYLHLRGFEVAKLRMKLNNRSAFCISKDNEEKVLTDYELLAFASNY